MRKSLKIRQEVSDDREERRRIASVATNTEKKKNLAKERRDRSHAANAVDLVVKVRLQFVFTNTIICIYKYYYLYLHNPKFVFTKSILCIYKYDL